jgi:8-oxo-dGTP pyrophosphatase MutT (NUDIX family)
VQEPGEVEPREAATVVLMRPAAEGFEVFLQRRVPTMVFAPGVTVFPGGARDPGDADLRQTAVRETLEETGVQLVPDQLRPWARWITPVGEPRRYDTMFYVAALPAGAEPSPRGTEMDEVSWQRPVDALSARARGELGLWAPTLVTLRELAGYADLDAVLAAAAARSLRPVRPSLQDDGDELVVRMPDGEVIDP